MPSLKERIQEDVKDAMRARDKDRLAAIRLITAAIKQREVDERIELDDAQVTAVLDRMARQRRESITQFEKAGRDDLIARENAELEIIRDYLPEQLTEDELQLLIDEALEQTRASTIKDMGKVMGLLKPRLQGRTDMAAVSAMIKSRLG
jgi:uncharacterized protein YqeY